MKTTTNKLGVSLTGEAFKSTEVDTVKTKGYKYTFDVEDLNSPGLDKTTIYKHNLRGQNHLIEVDVEKVSRLLRFPELNSVKVIESVFKSIFLVKTWEDPNVPFETTHT